MSNWLKRLFGGGSDSSSEPAEPATAPEPVTAPEPATMPSEPDVDAPVGAEEPAAEEPAGDAPAGDESA